MEENSRMPFLSFLTVLMPILGGIFIYFLTESKYLGLFTGIISLVITMVVVACMLVTETEDE